MTVGSLCPASFTHDLAFVLALKKHAIKSSVPVTERSIERLGAKPDHCQDFHKFSAKLVKERLSELDDQLAALRTDRDSLTAEEHRDRTAKWYKLLRQTWEFQRFTARTDGQLHLFGRHSFPRSALEGNDLSPRGAG